MLTNEISCVIVQMRLGSSRLPKKMVKKLHGYTIAEWVSEGVEASIADKIIYALPHSDQNSELHLILKDKTNNNRVSIFFGDEDNVFERFRGALVNLKTNERCRPISLIRICGDRPFIQPENINMLINKNLDGLSFNHHDCNESYQGYGAERLSAKLTNELFFESNISFADKEHITKNIYDIEHIPKKCVWDPEVYSVFKRLNLQKLDLDTKEDLEILEYVVAKYSLNPFRRLPS